MRLRKKPLPHVHKPGECFSIEDFPDELPWDPKKIAQEEEDSEPTSESELEEEEGSSSEQESE